MRDPEFLLIYNLIFSAITKDGRDELFGKRPEAECDVFSKSYAGGGFPEIWFELPLLGEPWYDLHVLTSRNALDDRTELPEGIFHPGLFRWFSKHDGVRQLAMSHDFSKGVYDDPAAQLLVTVKDPSVGCSFLEEAGNHSAVFAYNSFVNSIPENWFACYLGTFPERNDVNLRVECIPAQSLQDLYASDTGILRDDLARTGLVLSDGMLGFISFMAKQPVSIEFQYNVNADGSAAPILGVSLRYQIPIPRFANKAFTEDNENVISLMSALSDAGLCDDRWRLLPGCAFMNRLKVQDASIRFGGYTSFIKVRMTCDRLIDAKTYIVANVI